MLFLALLACRTNADCADGFTLADDGMCYGKEAVDTDEDTTPTPEPATLQDVLDAWPACEPVLADGRLDVFAGCADGACIGMTYDEIGSVLGDEGRCSRFHLQIGDRVSSGVSCSWNGIGATFADEDGDGVADPGSTAYALRLEAPFDGGSPEGLGLGASFACFRDTFGEPNSVYFESEGPDWFVTSAEWDDQGVFASDSSGSGGSYEPDGLVDALWVSGSIVELQAQADTARLPPPPRP